MEKSDNYNLRIDEIINKYGFFMLRNHNIVAIGRGNKIINGHMINQPTLTFFVRNKLTNNSLNQSDIIPKSIRGVMTDILEAGISTGVQPKRNMLRIKANLSLKKNEYMLSDGLLEEDKTALSGGCLYALYKERYIASATMTYAVVDKVSKKNIYCLTSRHFLDPDNDFNENTAIYYARKYRSFSSIKEFKENTMLLGITKKVSKYGKISAGRDGVIQSVDAGLISVGPNNQDTRAKIRSGLLNGKVISNTEVPKRGDICYRIGAITGYAEERVTTVNTLAKLYHEDDITYDLYTDQISLQPITVSLETGDSGSLGVIKNRITAFGMLNGGYANASYFSHMNKILEEFNIEFLL